ncbi:putative AraC family transcriptional regulator [Gordonia effusa NBRC 100432]|uniref:Putative AraC family transcriptional regulator n=1 Tax=Gordonia effusa NBRC 100432 TaxID=1077974 RepID=H0R104_9ACTN|nr:AraC family transcriptional regulator [Gordonia effusa]GAB18755.1 putative AraC family transcriptional regulator [Gordonia effusa NBRC 100432]
MDALGSLLSGPRAQAPFLLRMVMAGSWSVRIEDEAPLTVVAVNRGEILVTYPDGATHRLLTGSIALFRGTESYLVGDTAGSPVVAVIDANGDCYDPTGSQPVAEQMRRGVRSWGNADQDADTVALIGAYQLGEVGKPLLAALGRVTVVAAHDNPLIELLDTELAVTAPAQEAVLNRLLDLILVTTLRTHLAADPSQAPRWYRAHTDPVVGSALALMHNNVERGWTVESLADQTGVSRACLARRFAGLVGEPPMAYLTDWRLRVAADLLLGSDLTMARIAERVGYSSAFAFSSAFKRRRGITPTEYRRVAAGDVGETRLPMP